MEILRVSSKSNPNSVAGALVALIKETGKIEIQAVGAGAVNQSVKAIAIARGFVASSGIELTVIPAFTQVDVEGLSRTGIKFIVKEIR